jgi:hypothetical protein
LLDVIVRDGYRLRVFGNKVLREYVNLGDRK